MCPNVQEIQAVVEHLTCVILVFVAPEAGDTFQHVGTKRDISHKTVGEFLGMFVGNKAGVLRQNVSFLFKNHMRHYLNSRLG